MKPLLGWLQTAGLIGGVVALFNGQWVAMVGSWLFAVLVGLAGDRLVRSAEGLSQSGQDAMGAIPRTIELLRQGQYAQARGTSRSAVTSFRMGGDKQLLPIALTLHAVTLAANRDIEGADNALTEAARLFDNMPAGLAEEAADIRELHALVRREVRTGVPDPSGFVERFLALNAAV